jgi:hypothetical protein
MDYKAAEKRVRSSTRSRSLKIYLETAVYKSLIQVENETLAPHVVGRYRRQERAQFAILI